MRRDVLSVTRATDESYTLEQTELEVVANVAQGHQPMSTVLNSRHRNLQVVHNLWQHKDVKVRQPTTILSHLLSLL